MVDTVVTNTLAGAVFDDGTDLSGSWTVEYDPAGAIVAITDVDLTAVGPGGTTTFTSLGSLPYADPTAGGGYQVHDLASTGGTYVGLYLDTQGEQPTSLATTLGNGLFSSIEDNGTIYSLQSTGVIVAQVECFCAGTHILTVDGEVAVENLKAGDVVRTLNGHTPVTSVQRTTFSGSAQIASAQIRPIRICAGALAENVPHSNLYVSPDHSVLLEGYFVPAHLLVNGTSITQPARAEPIEYFHVEIEPHGVLYAEGAPTESYLNIGRQATGGDVAALFPGAEPKSWEDACAPLLLSGPALAGIRANIALRAEQFDTAKAA